MEQLHRASEARPLRQLLWRCILQSTVLESPVDKLLRPSNSHSAADQILQLFLQHFDLRTLLADDQTCLAT